MQQGYPIAGAGQRIGLLGGSFNPPHSGHVHISHQALKGFGLDRVWWLVSPGNPLKANPPAPLPQRMAACRALIADPRIIATDIEARIGTRYTADTLRHITAMYPQVQFIWLMGADNLSQFHMWEDWKGIFHRVPVGITARPRENLAALASVTAHRFARFRLPQDRSRELGRGELPEWCLLRGPMVDISSTELRQNGGWGA